MIALHTHTPSDLVRCPIMLLRLSDTLASPTQKDTFTLWQVFGLVGQTVSCVVISHVSPSALLLSGHAPNGYSDLLSKGQVKQMTLGGGTNDQSPSHKSLPGPPVTTTQVPRSQPQSPPRFTAQVPGRPVTSPVKGLESQARYPGPPVPTSAFTQVHSTSHKSPGHRPVQ